MPRDMKKLRAYQNRWMKQRRLDWISSQGGKCVKCGSTENLEVDHIDPKLKVTHRLWSRNQAFREAELSKCQVLCKTCNIAKEHHQIHGTRSRYTAGCRCNKCVSVAKIRFKQMAEKQRLKRHEKQSASLI